MPPTAYLAALRMLARRELSERQIRTRLERLGHEATEIEAAVRRLIDERALDDRRVAEAIARTQAGLKRRGPVRVRLELERAGIARDVARAAADAVFEGAEPDVLIEAALARRLRGRSIADLAELRRLHRYLVAQGFDAERALDVLKRRGPAPRD